MTRFWKKARCWSTRTALMSPLLILGGCDPTIRATVENGIITMSSSFMTALVQAILQLAQE